MSEQIKQPEMFHHYDRTNSFYLGSSEAEYDPLDKKPAIPAFATMVPLPERKPGTWPAFEGGQWVLRELPEDQLPRIPHSVMFEEEALAAALKDVDSTADGYRVLIVGDPFRAMEYKLAETDARLFLSDPSNDVPLSVQAWADSKGCDAYEAATDIVAQADKQIADLSRLRAARLAAKAKIRAAPHKDRPAARSEALNDLHAALSAPRPLTQVITVHNAGEDEKEPE